MRKRIISLALAFAVLLLGAAGLHLAAAESTGSTVSKGAEIRYVYTENGKSLNVRSGDWSGAAVIGTLHFGAQAAVLRTLGNGWSEIMWGNSGSAYVMSRFLVSEKPGGTPSGSIPKPDGTVSDAMAEMNREFRAARKVASYTVLSRPVRAPGWVNLRWAPSMEAEVIATCPQGKELTVIAELRTWYQVQDPATGMIGFISRKYTQVK